MESLTFICWLWQGWRKMYTARHVNALGRMLRHHMTVPYRLVCLTDSPHGITEAETLPMLPFPPVPFLRERQPDCYRRLALFSPHAVLLGDRLVSIDLDCVVFGDLAPLLTPQDFKIAKGKISPYNGSMWMLRAGAHPEVFTKFDPNKSPNEAFAHTDPETGGNYLGSDQAWISHMLPGMPTWGPKDGVYMHYLLPQYTRTVKPANCRIVFFPGLIKPWDNEVAFNTPYAHQHYMKFYS